jgi:hypothetical protein
VITCSEPILSHCITWKECTLLFRVSGLFTENDPDLDRLDIFLRKLSEIEPTLKEEIIQGLQKPVGIYNQIVNAHFLSLNPSSTGHCNQLSLGSNYVSHS